MSRPASTPLRDKVGIYDITRAAAWAAGHVGGDGVDGGSTQERARLRMEASASTSAAARVRCRCGHTWPAWHARRAYTNAHLMGSIAI
eukprot:1570811-Prymnesium_polylepis.2